MLIFAFDASGDEGTAYLTVAGFASSASHWDEFSQKWKARLDRDGIEFFHAVDANNFRGPFAHWRELPDRERLRQHLFEDLMDLIEGYAYQKFSCTVLNRDYRTTDNELRRQFAESAYSYAVRVCERHARDWARDEWRSCTHMKLACVLEAGDGGQNEGKMRERLGRDYGHIPPTFRPKKDSRRKDGIEVAGFVPLQASDWLAWELNRAFRDLHEGRASGDGDLRWPMRQFFRHPSPHMAVVGSEELKSTDGVISAIDRVIGLKEWVALIKGVNSAREKSW